MGRLTGQPLTATAGYSSSYAAYDRQRPAIRLYTMTMCSAHTTWSGKKQPWYLVCVC